MQKRKKLVLRLQLKAIIESVILAVKLASYQCCKQQSGYYTIAYSDGIITLDYVKSSSIHSLVKSSYYKTVYYLEPSGVRKTFLSRYFDIHDASVTRLSTIHGTDE